MRFLMVDRVLALEPGRRIETLKCFGLADECLRGHFPRRPLVPGALLIEAILQSLGRLIMVTHEHRVATVLAAMDEVTVAHDLGPGRPVTIVGELLSTNPKGSVGRATATADGRVVAAVGRALYGQFPHPDPAGLRARFQALDGPP
jgi:3-hydroxyacyl-[acyl-carrier-protein] dehydratase